MSFGGLRRPLVRLALVEREQPSLPLTRQAELLSLSRSGLYYVPTPVSAAEVAIKRAIDKIHTQYPFYGSRRITVELRAQHHLQVACETIQRSMRDMGIADSANNPAGDFHVLSDEVRLNWLPQPTPTGMSTGRRITRRYRI